MTQPSISPPGAGAAFAGEIRDRLERLFDAEWSARVAALGGPAVARAAIAEPGAAAER